MASMQNMESDLNPNKQDSDGNRFDELPEELKLEILRRLEPKLAAGAAGVSKSWLRLITAHCIPKTSPSGLPFATALVFVGTGPRDMRAVLFSHRSNNKAVPAGDVGLARAVRILPPGIAAESLVDCSNGLLLFCDRRVDEGPYHYLVFNYATGQCGRVAKPLRGEMRSQAVLAYTPSRSSFFRIVQFDKFATDAIGCVNVYWSETRSWETIVYLLDERIVNARWSEQSFFVGGAVYRLSDSGHLLRFEIDKIVDLYAQAIAIDLPKEASKDPSQMCIGISENRIHFMSFDEELRLRIWSLADGHSWAMLGVVPNLHQKREYEGNFIKPLGFHPNSNVVFVGANSQTCGSSITWIRFGGEEDKTGAREIEYFHRNGITFVENWRGVVAFPSLYCHVSFASGFQHKPSCTW